MTNIADQAFVQQLMQIGIVKYNEQETLLGIAKRCAKTTGIPAGGAALAMGRTPQAFLAGVLAGTVMCTMANTALRDQLRQLASGQ